MFMKVYACSMFFHEAGPSITSSVVPGFFDLSFCIEELDISSITENKEEKLRVRRHSQLPNDMGVGGQRHAPAALPPGKTR